MKLAANLAALTAITIAAASLSAQQTDVTKPAAIAAKPKPKPLSIDEVEKLQAAKAAAAKTAAAKPATGSTGPKATAPTATATTDTTAVKRAAPKPPPYAAPLVHPKPAQSASHPLVIVPPYTLNDREAAAAKAATTAPKAAPKSAVAAAPKPASAPQQPAAPTGPAVGAMNRTTIVLDPAHGGNDNGSRISDNLVEKDVTLAFAFKLRSLLQARGFNVILTRDADLTTTDSNPNPLSLDDRAGIANHARPVACLLLHATGAGAGVHLYHSELNPANGEAATLPWLTAQSAWIAQSTTLTGKLAQSFTRAGIPLVSSAASVRPVDSLTCPALVIELAPKDGDAASLSDSGYQQSVAEAVAGTLVFWKNQAQPPAKLAEPSAEAQ